MTTVRHTSERQICDVPDCKREAGPGGDFALDKHLCLTHRTMLSQATIDALRESSRDCLRESHEGGTQHLPAALLGFSQTWDRAIYEIQTAHLRCE